MVPEVREDFKRLPPKAKRVALGWMSRLSREPRLGKHLEWRRGADLSSCWKLYFDLDDEPLKLLPVRQPKRVGGPRYRIVYQLPPRDERPTHVLVLAIGKKRDPAGTVYESAARRLKP